jgi:hypothetical protein
LVTELFVLEPLGPRHHDADFRAWTCSVDHIRATPGFSAEHWGGDQWPYLMSADDNLSDLAEHEREFLAGEAFAYTVLDPGDGDVIGCVYVDPDEVAEARCRLWVRADRAHLDATLFAEVRTWLTGPAWDLALVHFPGRDRPDRR